MTAVWLGSLDQSIANTALPAIAAALQHTPAESVWILHAYQLAVVATLLPFAALGDLWGARRVFLVGVALFNLAAIASALAPSLEWLAVSRAVQGIGASGLMSVNLALIRQIFPTNRLGQGVGLNAFIVGSGYSLGPVVASLLLSVGPWPWLFGFMVPMELVVHELQLSAVACGTLMTVWAGVVAIAAPLAGRLSDRYPPAIMGGIGLCILSAGMVWLSQVTVGTSTTTIGVGMAICGIGFGLFQSPNLRAIMSSSPPERSSGASGMVALARLIGQASGAALVALCFNLFAPVGAGHAIVIGAVAAGLGGLLSVSRLWAR